MPKLNKDIVRQAYIPKNAPSDREIGWLGHRKHKRFHGTDKSVQVKFDPSDEKIRDNFIYHTHPNENPSPLTAMPSEQDLISAIMSMEHGVKGSTIFSGNYYTVFVPTDKIRKISSFARYRKAVQRGDIEDALNALKFYGFDVETGSL